MIHLVETPLQIGIKEPFSVWHMSDTHLTKADARENERKQTLARERTATYLRVRADSAEELLADATRICSETKLPLLYTGDLIDFTSAANLESGRDFIRATDCLFAVGNHEFSQYVGEAWEDEAYKAVSADGVREMLGCDYSVVTRVISGVNFVAIDNNYYRFTEAQHRRLREEVEKGLPVVLLLHNPLYEEMLYRTMMQRSDCAYLVATPPELMQFYSEHRYKQQLADEPTLATVRYIETEERIRAVIAGHLHFDYEGTVAEHLPQIVTGMASLRKITFQ